MAPLQHVSVFCLVEVRVNGARAVSPATSALRRDVPGVARVGAVAPTPRRSLPALRPGRSCAGQSLAAVNDEATVILRRVFCPPLPHPPAMQGFPGRICDLAPRHMSSVWLKYILKKQLLKKLLLLLPLGGELPGSELLQLR